MRALSDEDLDAIAVLFDTVILTRLDQLDNRLRAIMATLAELAAEDAALQTEVDAVIQLVKDDSALIAQLQATIGSGNLSADQQAAVDNLFAQVTAQHDAIAAALSPPVPAPAPAPVAEPAPAPADVPPPAPAP